MCAAIAHALASSKSQDVTNFGQEIFQLHLCEDYGSYSEATEAGGAVYSPPFECACVVRAPFDFDLFFFTGSLCQLTTSSSHLSVPELGR